MTHSQVPNILVVWLDKASARPWTHFFNLYRTYLLLDIFLGRIGTKVNTCRPDYIYLPTKLVNQDPKIYVSIFWSNVSGSQLFLPATRLLLCIMSHVCKCPFQMELIVKSETKCRGNESIEGAQDSCGNMASQTKGTLHTA